MVIFLYYLCIIFKMCEKKKEKRKNEKKVFRYFFLWEGEFIVNIFTLTSK